MEMVVYKEILESRTSVRIKRVKISTVGVEKVIYNNNSKYNNNSNNITHNRYSIDYSIPSCTATEKGS